MNQEYTERLQLTYKPEEFASSSEGDKSPSDEHKPLPSDFVPVSVDEVAPPRPPNNFDDGDLLVNYICMVLIG